MFAPPIKEPQAKTASPTTPTRTSQPKLTIGQFNDPLEREADRVADQVMRTPSSPTVARTAPPLISHKCITCEEAQALQPRWIPSTRGLTGEAPASVRRALSTPGRPLDAATRAYF